MLSLRANAHGVKTNENHLKKASPLPRSNLSAKIPKKAVILLATLKGVTTEDIMKLTGWAKSAASSAIATDIVPLGYKVTLDDGVYTVQLPKGMKRPAMR